MNAFHQHVGGYENTAFAGIDNRGVITNAFKRCLVLQEELIINSVNQSELSKFAYFGAFAHSFLKQLADWEGSLSRKSKIILLYAEFIS